MARHGLRIAELILGWVLVVAGIAALALPGPGLLTLFAGMAILARHYEWARKRLEPVKRAAMKTAAEGVRDFKRITLSILGILFLVAVGVLWMVKPPAPGWWPVSDFWWLPGGWGTSLALFVSAAFAAALLIYSYRKFRDPDSLAELVAAKTGHEPGDAATHEREAPSG